MAIPVQLNGPISPREALTIHLRDQHAIARGVLSLAQRAAANQRGTSSEPELDRLVSDLHEDQRALLRAMRQVGTSPSLVKTYGAQLGERAGRLKLNGQVRGSSPLSPVVELEGLLDGLTAGHNVWVVLRDHAGVALEGVDAARMVERKVDQLDRVRALWHDAARSAFSDHDS